MGYEWKSGIASKSISPITKFKDKRCIVEFGSLDKGQFFQLQREADLSDFGVGDVLLKINNVCEPSHNTYSFTEGRPGGVGSLVKCILITADIRLSFTDCMEDSQKNKDSTE